MNITLPETLSSANIAGPKAETKIATRSEITQVAVDKLKLKLMEEYGLNYLPNSNLLPLAPSIDGETIARRFGKKNQKDAATMINLSMGYLNGQPIVDRFGADDAARRRWLEEMVNEYDRKLFGRAYFDINQLRPTFLNRITACLEILTEMALEGDTPGLSDSLKPIYKGLSRLIMPPAKRMNYSFLPVQKQLIIVHKFENGILDALEVIAGKKNVTPSR